MYIQMYDFEDALSDVLKYENQFIFKKAWLHETKLEWITYWAEKTSKIRFRFIYLFSIITQKIQILLYPIIKFLYFKITESKFQQIPLAISKKPEPVTSTVWYSQCQMNWTDRGIDNKIKRVPGIVQNRIRSIYIDIHSSPKKNATKSYRTILFSIRKIISTTRHKRE